MKIKCNLRVVGINGTDALDEVFVTASDPYINHVFYAPHGAFKSGQHEMSFEPVPEPVANESVRETSE